MIIRSDQIESREPIIITVSEFHGKNRLDIRHYFIMNDGPHPTKHGINILLSEAEAIFSAVQTLINDPSIKKIVPPLGNAMVVCTVGEYRETMRLDIRHYWTPEGKTEAIPTRKGVNIPVDRASQFLSEFRNVLSQAQQIGESRFSKVETE